MKIDNDTLTQWITSYNYEETNTGIGYCRAKIHVRDQEDDMKQTFNEMTKDEKDDLACALIQRVSYPCEDYFDDFADESSAFGYEIKWDAKTSSILFNATFRV